MHHLVNTLLEQVLQAHRTVPVSDAEEEDHPYKSKCACGEWCYNHSAHVVRAQVASLALFGYLEPPTEEGADIAPLRPTAAMEAMAEVREGLARLRAQGDHGPSAALSVEMAVARLLRVLTFPGETVAPDA